MHRWNHAPSRHVLVTLQALASWEDTGERPEVKLSWRGPKLDAIDHYSAEMVELQMQIVDQRELALSGKASTFTGSYIVLFK